jgi:hypothetical protein
MKIKYDWFKDSGKWYEGGEANVPDNLFLFSDDLILAINPSHDFWFRRAQAGWYLVLDNVDMSEKESLEGKFMKSLWMPESILKKLERV